MENKIQELRQLTNVIAAKNPVLDAFQRARKEKESEITEEQAGTSTKDRTPTSDTGCSSSQSAVEVELEETQVETGNGIPKPAKQKFKQEALLKELEGQKQRILALRGILKSGLTLTQEQKTQLKELENAKAFTKKSLKRLEQNRLSALKAREKRKRLATAVGQSQDRGQGLQSEKAIPKGRPRLEREQPGLLDAILDIVGTTASADERRRTEQLRTCQTLDNLLNELKQMGTRLGFNILSQALAKI